jgi:urease subunit beta
MRISSLIPGEYFLLDRPIIANAKRKMIAMNVSNTGDRPIQVGSHTHFFEVNKALAFEREKAYGFHLNIPAGTSVRFEPGDTKKVQLTEFGGKKRVFGFSGLVGGSLSQNKRAALTRLRKRGFRELK